MENSNKNNTGAAVSPQRTSDIKENLSDAVTGDKEAAKKVYSQAKGRAEKAVEKVYGKVSDETSAKISDKKSQVAQGLSTVADNLRQADESMQNTDQETPIANIAGKYTDSLAGKIEQASEYIERKDLGEMLGDAERFARRNPAIFIGGAFTLGLLLARFLKSSGSKSNANNSRSNDTTSNDIKQIG